MKRLVVYYSQSGNTRAVARRIAQSLEADLVELKTVKEYPDDYDVLESLGKREVESGYMPQLKPLPVDPMLYDAIVIGTPVWWYTFAPAVKKFLSSYQWQGKKVYPFATNGGVLGHTSGDFKKALRGATVAPVLNVKFDEKTQRTPAETVDAWVSQIKANKE